jgi:hypothetical protein
MDEILNVCEILIQSCADKLCFHFECPGLREDLNSCGRLAVLERAADYLTGSGAAVTTYLYPFILGAMRRELETSLFSMLFSKRGFEKQLEFAFVSLDEAFEDEDCDEWSLVPASPIDVERAVFAKSIWNFSEKSLSNVPSRTKKSSVGFSARSAMKNSRRRRLLSPFK